ncbi:PP2C family protein-serine/threonine phosphatase [Nocardioides panaciterrulae]|uniref:Protein phosphatase n=1 Tax=Nocardioides panaciterrulae TaxID=661492 RepID=A0A7Y9JBN7_9ACTN|nr:protein phosphatase 2C domain-containing protein [Nocardioides panaciterrulae]NYD41424.1 protein phosphatase [Nocardioides panaciterrulae]
MLRFSGRGVTNTGLVREHNEDAAFVGPYLALVADGVGGAAAGEIAAATTAYVVAATALAHLRGGAFDVAPQRLLQDAAEAARANLVAGVAVDERRRGMATTLSAVVCDGRRVVLGHVGDSRVYLYREARLRQLSHDHTWVQKLLDEGRITTEVAARHPWRNVVVRSLDGSGVMPVDLDLVEVEVLEGDRLLLCSDGLTDLVGPEGLAAALALPDPAEAAEELEQRALAAGGHDNVTCLVLDLVHGPVVVGDGQLLGAVADPANIVDPAAVHLV